MDRLLDLRLQCPCVIQTCGYSSSGKSVLTADMVRNRHRLFTHTFSRVLWLYSQWQPLYDQLQLDVPEIIFIKSIKEAEKYIEEPKPNKPPPSVLLVADDMVLEIIGNNNNDFLSYALQKSHHRNVTVIVLTQALFLPKARLLQINSQYILCMQLNRDSSSILRLGCQLMPMNPRFVYKAYKHSVLRKKFAHFLIDSHALQDDIARYRSTVFYWDKSLLLYEPQNDDSRKKL
jgi:hypothetical protein